MRLVLLVAVVGIVVACLFVAFTVLTHDGTGQRTEEKIDQAVGQLRTGAKDVAGRIREEFQEASAEVDRLSVAGRVYARLHWDKALQDASISVDVDKAGLATLHGTVPTEAAKAKAQRLAHDTVGVQNVANDLNMCCLN